jgi:hypothetical protein
LDWEIGCIAANIFLSCLSGYRWRNINGKFLVLGFHGCLIHSSGSWASVALLVLKLNFSWQMLQLLCSVNMSGILSFGVCKNLVCGVCDWLVLSLMLAKHSLNQKWLHFWYRDGTYEYWIWKFMCRCVCLTSVHFSTGGEGDFVSCSFKCLSLVPTMKLFCC